MVSDVLFELVDLWIVVGDRLADQKIGQRKQQTEPVDGQHSGLRMLRNVQLLVNYVEMNEACLSMG